jgi:hypothetical protein
MPTSTQESGRDRRLMLESLQTFGRGDGDAPLVTKWTHAADEGTGISSGNSTKDAKDQAITFVLSTDDVDRHGDVVSADGWVLDSYRKNPVLLTQLRTQNDWVRQSKPQHHFCRG